MRENDGTVQVREARSGEYEEVGRLPRAAWEEFARPGDPVWEAYFALLGDEAADVAISPDTTLLGYRLVL